MIFFIDVHGTESTAVVGASYGALQYIAVCLAGRPKYVTFISHVQLPPIFMIITGKAVMLTYFCQIILTRQAVKQIVEILTRLFAIAQSDGIA
jgi:hypothetical protein